MAPGGLRLSHKTCGDAITDLQPNGEVEIENGAAKIKMLLTTPFCPYGPALIDIAKQKAQEALNMPVTIELGYEPWDFSMMEDPGAIDWGMYT
jgi:metal-sulfur cluster biosynthetic enzyme